NKVTTKQTHPLYAVRPVCYRASVQPLAGWPLALCFHTDVLLWRSGVLAASLTLSAALLRCLLLGLLNDLQGGPLTHPLECPLEYLLPALAQNNLSLSHPPLGRF